MSERRPYALVYPTKRSMEVFPVACPVCDEPPGYPCRTVGLRRRAHYQHVARRRLRGLLRAVEKGSSS